MSNVIKECDASLFAVVEDNVWEELGVRQDQLTGGAEDWNGETECNQVV